MSEIKLPFLIVEQTQRKFLLTKMPARVLVKISYVAVRRQSEEQGAVQRVLNQRRIGSIKEFTLKVGEYPGAIVLNWVNTKNLLQKEDNLISFVDEPSSAQIVDGQHRLVGIQEAIKENETIGELELPVVIYENLTTRDCADIFLSINTEQKTVDRSLVFDLYGIASEPVIDPAALRARDISMYLNEEQESPYYDALKLPNSPRRKGGIALSTAVTSLKPLVEEKGDFDRVGVKELELQKKILLNFFRALCSKYGNEWDKNTNVFMYGAGFTGAIEFLKLKIVPYCNMKRSFSLATISQVINLNKSNLIYQSAVKGLSGKEATKKIYDLLVQAFTPESSTEKFEI